MIASHSRGSLNCARSLVIKARNPGIFGVGKDPEVFLALLGQLGDVHDFVAEQCVAQRLDDLYGGVFVDEETHHAARDAGSKLST